MCGCVGVCMCGCVGVGERDLSVCMKGGLQLSGRFNQGGS